MIEHRTGDLLKQLDLDGITECRNCFNTMGSGIALAVKNKWPEVFEADLATESGDKAKLGALSIVDVNLDNGKKCLYMGIYGQYQYGIGQRQVNYEAIYRGFERIKQRATEEATTLNRPFVLGLPYKMACDRAGGSWLVLEAMLKTLFENDVTIKVVICRLC